MEQNDNKPVQDDHDWFDALSGKKDGGQGAKLRDTLRKLEQKDADQEEITHDWHRLKFALKREMANKEKKPVFGQHYFAMAASVILVIGVGNLLIRNDGGQYDATDVAMHGSQYEAKSVVMRGSTEQVVISQNPSQESKNLESELLHLGINVSRSETIDGIKINIPLSYPVPNEVRVVLESRVIPVPDQGDLTVIFIVSAE